MDSDSINKTKAQIEQAIDVIYQPKSTNFERLEATKFLESVKQEESSIFLGPTLYNESEQTTVKHYGLQLVDYNICHKYSTGLSKDMKQHVKTWLIESCFKIDDKTPKFIKEKLAFLWVSIAKREYGECCKYNINGELLQTNSEKSDEKLNQIDSNNNTGNYQYSTKSGYKSDDPNNLRNDPPRLLQDLSSSIQEMLNESWYDMDSHLLQLWEKGEQENSLYLKEMTLLIFRTLFEDIFLLLDYVAMKRIPVLHPLSMLLISTPEIYQLKYEVDNLWSYFKFNSIGWFNTWCKELERFIIKNDTIAPLTENECNYLVKLLETFKNCITWPFSDVIAESNLIKLLFKVLLIGDSKMQTVALDSLHIAYTRSYNDAEQLESMMNIYINSVSILGEVYRKLKMDYHDYIDDEKYSVIKKYVDMLVSFHMLFFNLINKGTLENKQIAIDYLNLVFEVSNDQSLVVSGLALDMWVFLLRQDEKLDFLSETGLIMKLLDFSSSQLIYFEEIEDHPSKLLLDMDFQSDHEFKSFCSLYRKSLRDIIRLITCCKLDYSFQWLNERLNRYFSSPYGQEVLQVDYLDHRKNAYLSCLSQLMIIECFIKGCIRWKIWYAEQPDYEEKHIGLKNNLKTLSDQLLSLSLKDPMLLKKQVQNFSFFLNILQDEALFILLERIMTIATLNFPGENPALAEYDEKQESIKNLKYTCGLELNRMALLMPNSLAKIYGQLEDVVGKVLNNLSYHEVISFKSFLMIIVLKADDFEDRINKFASIVDPELAAWCDSGTITGLTDLHWFMERLGIKEIGEYFAKRNVTEETDLLSINVDEEGKSLKGELHLKWERLFPVRATRIFLHYSLEKVSDSFDWDMIYDIWKPRLFPILPYILRLLYQIQSYSDPNNWEGLPPVVKMIVKHSNTERFWEATASSKTKDEFISEHTKAFDTLRDFADSTGHAVRYTKEVVLAILAVASRLGAPLYEQENFANDLLNSIFIEKEVLKADGNKALTYSPGVSKHAWKNIINIAIKPLVKNCPTECMPSFYEKLLPRLFSNLNTLLVNYWSFYMNNDDFQPTAALDDEEMSEEILENSLLRLTTTVVVKMLVEMYDQQASCQNNNFDPMAKNMSSGNNKQNFAKSITLKNPEIGLQFLKLINNLMIFKDGKCSINSILVFKNFLSLLNAISNPQYDEFIICEMLPSILNNLLIDFNYKESFYDGLYCFISVLTYFAPKYPQSISWLSQMSYGYNMENLLSSLLQAKDYKARKNCMMDYLEYIKLQKNKMMGKNDDEEHFISLEHKKSMARRAMVAEAQKVLVQKNTKSQKEDLFADPNLEDNAIGSLFD
ncbi:hypothetical protein ACO0SA_000305 [Hanseniaspora valbyensis]